MFHTVKTTYTPPPIMSTRAPGGALCIPRHRLPRKDKVRGQIPSLLWLDRRGDRLYHHDADHGYLLLVRRPLRGDHCRPGLESGCRLIALLGGVDVLCRERLAGGTAVRPLRTTSAVPRGSHLLRS